MIICAFLLPLHFTTSANAKQNVDSPWMSTNGACSKMKLRYLFNSCLDQRSLGLRDGRMTIRKPYISIGMIMEARGESSAVYIL